MPNANTSAHYGLAPTRPELLAVVRFLNGSAAHAWDALDLWDWFDEHIVATGCMSFPPMVREAPVGQVALFPPTGAPGRSHALKLRRLLVAARARTLAAVRGLRVAPADDRFLAAAIFGGRVRRLRDHGRGAWVARPGADAPLSDVVMSLLTVDVLTHRDQYDRELCVCDTCGRIGFDPKALLRTRCSEHVPSDFSREGFSGTVGALGAPEDMMASPVSGRRPAALPLNRT
jgi:hypothetical protein